MFEHDTIRQLISLYFDNEASPEEKDIVEEHILGCADCKKYYQQLSKLHTSLRSVPEEGLSPDLEYKIKRGLARAQNREDTKMKNENLWPVAAKGISVFVVVFLVSLATYQTYLQRGLTGRLRSATDDLGDASPLTKPASTVPSTVIAVTPAQDNKKEARFMAGLAPVRESVPTKAYHADQRLDRLAGPQAAQGTAGSYPQATSEVLRQKGNEGELSYEPYYLKSDYQVTRDESAAYGTPAPATRTRAFSGKMVQEQDAQRYDRFAVSQPYDHPYPADTEEYALFGENQFLTAAVQPLSTFSIDVDTASYANIRRFLNQGQLPPEESVRLEEMINYFKYDYPKPLWEPFSITTEVSQCPWQPSHQLVLIGLQGKVPNADHLPPSNLVFLVDVSGSMADQNKLSLLKDSLLKMLPQLRKEDRVSIVTYSDNANVVIAGVPGDQTWQISDAIRRLQAQGSTAGWDGVQLAYRVAQDYFVRNGNNRVLLATDGDFNVGPSSDAAMVRLIEEKRQGNIFLTVLGFGTGNLKDSKLVQMADKGNGTYSYIDSPQEADKVLVREMGSTLFAIAKDVKIQVEFNPATVKAYRLIGYEKRSLASEDFNNDRIDAGELGAGHTVTALYEIVPSEPQPWVVYRDGRPAVDPLKYQNEALPGQRKVTARRDLMTVKLRYKEPKANTSRLIEKTVGPSHFKLWPESSNFRWAAAVAELGLLLRNSPYKGYASYDHVIQEAGQTLGADPEGQRSEFISLAQRAAQLDRRPPRYIDDVYRYDDPEYWPLPYRQKQQKIQFK